MTDDRLGSDPEDLSKQLAGLVVAELTHPAPEAIAIHFTSGAALVVRHGGAALSAVLRPPQRRGAHHNTAPTPRQREYLEFINKYMTRFGAAPAESDVQRHFLVSAPSVNQMIRTLERRGFIERDRDWSGQALPRSIRVVWNG